MAKLREISPEELKQILAEHKKWVESDGKEGMQAKLNGVYLGVANLSGADLQGADLKEADLGGADLKGANLKWADLRMANLRKAGLTGADLSDVDLRLARLTWANLIGADLSHADLCQTKFREANLSGANLIGADLSHADLSHADLSHADLSGADLRQTNLTWANLIGANLKGVDLSEAYLALTKINEEDLSGVKYRPEQLKDMIIERSEKESLIAPKQKGRLIIRLKGENIPLIHLIYLTAFIEYQYDILYILLFNQYESLDELQQILSGSPFHKLQGKDEAVKIKHISTGSLLTELVGQNANWVVLGAFTGYQIVKRTDLLQRLVTWLFKSKKEKFEEEKLEVEIERIRAEIIGNNKDQFENTRKADEHQVDHLPPGEPGKPLLPALPDEGLKKLSHQIEKQKNDLSERPPCEDCLLSVLYLKEEGLLTNKLTPQENANLFEMHQKNVQREFESLRKQLGDFEMDIKEEDEKDT